MRERREGKRLLGWCLGTSSVKNLGGLEDGKESQRPFACESLDQERPTNGTFLGDRKMFSICDVQYMNH